MALIRFGSVVQAASGRLGAICFARQGGTPIVRTQPLRRSHDSAAALTTNAAWTHARRLWLQLSDDDRLSWQNAARQLASANRLGVVRQISAMSAYMASAVPALLAGDAPVSTAAPPGALIQPADLTAQVWPGGPANIIHEDWLFGNDFNLITKAQRCVRTNRSLPGQLWKIVSRKEPDFQSTNIWTDLCAALGTPQASEWIRFRFCRRFPAWPLTHTTDVHVQIPNVGPELIYNGDFQIGGTPPSGWDVTANAILTQSDYLPWADGQVASYTQSSAVGTRYFSVAFAKRFNLTGGQSYTLRFRYKRWSGNLQALQIAGTGMSTIALTVPLTGDIELWYPFEESFVPDGNATSCRPNFINYAPSTCEIDFDEISIRKDVA